jgi:NTP pyrophosphatase (non-canonical NTP hydrolase)
MIESEAMNRHKKIESNRMNTLCEKATHKYGGIPQKVKAIEEFSELIQALCKHSLKVSEENLNHIKEEMADCFIMLNQLTHIFGSVDSEIEIKLDRLEKQLSE